MDEQSVRDVNRIAAFLANEQLKSLSSKQSLDCIVLCGSAILNCAETVFKALEDNPKLTKTLIICGGTGHSTKYLYQAINNNPAYSAFAKSIEDEPESVVFYLIFRNFFSGKSIASQGCKVLMETESTNCGANASYTKKLLESESLQPENIVIVQDPTMSLRTLASFRNEYKDVMDPPEFTSIPTFVPSVKLEQENLVFDVAGVEASGLWHMDRFLDLILGEIPRLRDDANGYGPRGKGFIAHVDIPQSVEDSWLRLTSAKAPSRVLQLEPVTSSKLFNSDSSDDLLADPEESEPVVDEITSPSVRTSEKSTAAQLTNTRETIDLVDDDDDDNDDETETEEEEGEEEEENVCGPIQRKMLIIQVYVIDRIIAHRKAKKQFEYKVRWEDYGSEDDTWEPHDALAMSAAAAIDTYWASRGGYPPVTPNARKRKSSSIVPDSQSEALPISTKKPRSEVSTAGNAVDSSSTIAQHFNKEELPNSTTMPTSNVKPLGADINDPPPSLDADANEDEDEMAFSSLISGKQPVQTTQAMHSTSPMQNLPQSIRSSPAISNSKYLSPTKAPFTRPTPPTSVPLVAETPLSVPRRDFFTTADPEQHSDSSSEPTTKPWRIPIELVNWDLHAKILGLVKQKSGFMVNVEWHESKKQSIHTLNTIYKRMPQSMLKFYETHLVFVD